MSISRHVPEREYTEPADWLTGEKIEIGQGRSNLDPITPIVGVTGGMGRTSIPVVESTRQLPEKEIFTPGNVSRGEGPEYRGEPMDSRQMRGESAERDFGLQGRGSQSGPCPNCWSPIDLQGKVPLEERCLPAKLINDKSEGEPSRQEYPTPEQ